MGSDEVNYSKETYHLLELLNKIGIKGDKVEVCQESKYLGVVLSNEGSNQRDIVNRVTHGKIVKRMLNSIF